MPSSIHVYLPWLFVLGSLCVCVCVVIPTGDADHWALFNRVQFISPVVRLQGSQWGALPTVPVPQTPNPAIHLSGTNFCPFLKCIHLSAEGLLSVHTTFFAKPPAWGNWMEVCVFSRRLSFHYADLDCVSLYYPNTLVSPPINRDLSEVYLWRTSILNELDFRPRWPCAGWVEVDDGWMDNIISDSHPILSLHDLVQVQLLAHILKHTVRSNNVCYITFLDRFVFIFWSDQRKNNPIGNKMQQLDGHQRKMDFMPSLLTTNGKMYIQWFLSNRWSLALGALCFDGEAQAMVIFGDKLRLFWQKYNIQEYITKSSSQLCLEVEPQHILNGQKYMGILQNKFELVI